MTFRLKILDRYLCREFLTVLAGVVAACTVVLLIAKVFEEFDEILEGNATFAQACLYFVYVMPIRVLEIMPMATVLAVIFSIGALARNREMLAVTAGGRSPYRTSAPVLIAALAVGLLGLVLNETMVPYCEQNAEYYERVYIKGKIARTLRTDIFDKGIGNTFYSMTSFNSARKTMANVLMFEQSKDDPAILTYCLIAMSGRLVKEDAAKDRDLWAFQGAIEHYFDPRGMPMQMVRHPQPLRVEMEADLDDYLSNRKKPDQMNLIELGRYIRTLRMRGEDVAVYQTDWYLKLFFPFSTFILAMVAFALAMRAHTASLPMAFGKGVFLTMAFYALAAFAQTLGHVAVVPPLVGSLGPPLVFLVLGIYMIRRCGFAS